MTSTSRLVAEEILPCATLIDAQVPSQYLGCSATWVWLEASADHEQRWILSETLGLKESVPVICLCRWKIWWITPRIISSEKDVPPESLMLLAQRKDGSSLVLFPAMCASGMSFSLSASESRLHLCGYDNQKAKPISGNKRAMLCATGSDPLDVCELGMLLLKEAILQDCSHMLPDQGFTEVETMASTVADSGRNTAVLAEFTPPRSSQSKDEGTFGTSTSTSTSTSTDNVLPDTNTQLPFVDFLGWCTWDSFYTHLSPDKILKGLESFHAHGVRARFLIIDDGWQSTDCDSASNGEQWGGRLRAFAPNEKFAPRSFCSLQGVPTDPTDPTDTTKARSQRAPSKPEQPPSALRGLIAQLKQDLQVSQIFVWHTLLGYWAGVEPESPLGKLLGAQGTMP